MNKPKTYKVEIDIETMEDVIRLIDYCGKTFPFTKMSLWYFRDKLSNIIQHGCFKHNIIAEEFRTGPRETVMICKKCNPKEYARLKRESNNEL